MITVYYWHWGWYKQEFETRKEAEDFLSDQHTTAKLNIYPKPYMVNSNGKRIYTKWEIIETLQDILEV